MLVLSPTLDIVAVSDAYCRATLTERAAIMGRGLFEVFPDNPDDPASEGVRNLKASLDRVLRTGQPDSMAVQKYDVRRAPEQGGGFEQKFWSPQNTPIFRDGQLVYLLHRVEDVTALMGQREGPAVGTPIDAETGRQSLDVLLRAREVAATSRALKDANDQLQRLYEKTRELDQLKTQFFANVSHELRTPLALILGPLENLLDLPLSAQVREELKCINRNARLLLRHVNDLLDASKLEAGQMHLSRSEFDVSQLVRQVASSFDSLAREHSLSFRYDTPPALLAQVDADRVTQVLLNLLSNAFKFTPDGGTVRCTVRAAPSGSTLMIEVADSGPGIAPEQRDVIFERFRQLEGGSTRRFGGTGLGLSLARELTRMHGGSLSVAQAPEGGALFTLTLPVTAPEGTGSSKAVPSNEALNERIDLTLATVAHPTAPAPNESAAASARPMVLIIEDNPDMNRFIAECLSDTYRIATAFDGRAGLEQARLLRPDAIVSDYMMPEMTGDEVVTALRADSTFALTPFVMLTAKDDSATRVRLLGSGVNDYILKPFSVAEVRARVANLVNKRLVEATNERLKQALQTQNDELSAALAQASASNRELDAFSHSVSHDLRAPLRVVDGFSQALFEDYAGRLDDRAHDYLSRIRKSVKTMSLLIEDLLRLSRVSRATLEDETVDLVALSEQLQTELMQTLPAREHAIEFIKGERRLVRADARLMRVALSNLLSNAWKFTGQVLAPRVEVGWLEGPQGPYFAVKDNGAGFDMAYVEKLFGAFQRLHSEKEFPGTGVGLATAHRIAVRHGARLWAEASVGHGATFYLAFPLERMVPVRG